MHAAHRLTVRDLVSWLLHASTVHHCVKLQEDHVRRTALECLRSLGQWIKKWLILESRWLSLQVLEHSLGRSVEDSSKGTN